MQAWLLACTVEQTGGSPATATTTYTYDQSNPGDVVDVQDANGNHTSSAYDAYGDVTCSSVMPASPGTCATGGSTPDTTTTTYEPDGQVASTTQPNGNATGGNAALWTTTETYDAAGNQLTETDPGTTETITSAGCSGTTATVSFTAGSNPVPPVNASVSVTGVNPSGYNGSFQLTGSGSGSVSYTVPSCSGMTYVSGGSMVGETVNTYDGDGNLTFSRDDQGNVTGTAYDLDGQELATSDPGTNLAVTNATCSGTTATVSYASTSHYPPQGSDVFITGINPAGYDGAWKTTLSATDHVQYTVPSCSGMTYVGGGLLAPSASAQTYDAVGNQITSTDYGATPSVTTDAYDALNQQTTETIPGSGLTVTNDAWSSASCNGSAGTQTISYAATSVPPPKTGSTIVVTGINPSSLDGTFQVAGSTASTVWYCQASSPGTYSSGGTATSATDTTYYANGNQETSTDGDGNVELDTYYPSGLDATDYSAYGTSQQTSETYAYDGDGNTLTDQTASGTTTSTYNAAGWTLTSMDERGNPSSYAYDAMGNVTTETDPGSSIGVSSGSWAATTCGGSTGMATLNFPTNTRPSVQGTITVSGITPSAYDGTFTVQASSSSTVSYCVPGSNPGSGSAGTLQIPVVSHNTYDGAGRLLTTCTDGVPTGSLCTGSPASNPTVNNVYDNNGNVVTGKDAGSGDSSGQNKNPWQQSNMTDLAGQSLAQKSTPPDSSSNAVTTSYNANGDPSVVTNPNGTTATSTYDGSGRVTKIVYSDGTTPTVTYGYNSDGSVSQMTDGYGTTTYTYDAEGNLATESSPNGEMQYTWDPAGNLASVTYPDGNSVSYGYDSQGDMSSMTDSLGNSTTFKYDGSGNLTEADLPNGTVTSYAYDASSDLNKVSTTKSGTLQFSFDASGNYGIGPDGNVQSMTTSQQSNVGLRPGNGTAGNAGTDTYNYDPLQRVTADTQSGPSGTTSSSSMSYADNGELSSASGPTIHNGSYTYQGTTGHDAGKLQSIGSSLTFGYDAQGNRTCQGTGTPCSSNTTYTYGYDANNRLTSWADTTNDSETFAYDGNGLLQQTLYKTPGSVCPSIPQGPTATPWTPVPSISNRPRKDSSPGYCTDETNLVWNTALGTPTLAVDQQYATGVDEGHTDYIMGPEGLPVEQLAVAAGGGSGSGTPLYYYQDLQGNTRALEDGTGAVVNVQNYPPYGVATGSFGNTGWTPLQYDGTYTDGTTGFVYDQARWYDPSTGQFLSQDPLVDQTLQPHAYAGDQPITAHDPTGLCAGLVIFCIPNPIELIGNAVKDALDAVWNATEAVGTFLRRIVRTATVSCTHATKHRACVYGMPSGRDVRVGIFFYEEPLDLHPLEVAKALGRAGERLHGIDEGIPKRQIPSLSGTARRRLPDLLTKTSLTEVKNVRRLYLTSQLRDYLSYAERFHLRFDLVVRQGEGTKISGPLERLERQGRIRILRSLPKR